MKTWSTLLMVMILVAALPVLAQDGVPDLSHCQVWSSYEGPGTPTLMVQPDGQGPTFLEAQLADGSVVESIVYLRVLDWNDIPIANFPNEDLWLGSRDGGLVSCPFGTIADQQTDEAGLTYWMEPMSAGGFSEALTAVYVMGDNVAYDGINLSFNSPDIDGDGQVLLYDLSLLINNYFGEYDFRSDLFRDGQINLSDVGRFAGAMGTSCP